MIGGHLLLAAAALPSSLLNGLVGFWPMEGSANDVSGNGLHGTLTGSPPPSWVAGKIDLGAYLPIGASIVLPSLAAYFTTEGTFSAWVRLAEHTPLATRGGWYLDGDTAANTHYPYVDGNIYTGILSGSRKSIGPGVIGDRTQWHMVTVTAAPGANGWKLYQNTTLVFQAAGSAVIALPPLPRLGGALQNYYLNGVMDLVGFWNRVLTAAEIADLYNAGAGKAHPF